MPGRRDLTNKTFNRLTAICDVGVSKDGKRIWLFKCSCGLLKELVGKLVSRGNTKSCGCLQSDSRKKSKNRKHGHAKTVHKDSSRTYNSWFSMKSRCRTKTDSTFYMYGAKGISYDPAWESFEQFLADMGERPEGTSIDRVDRTKGYSKENCRWATPKEQVDNRAVTRKFEHDGQILTITDIAVKFGIPRERVKYRLTEKNESVAAMLEMLSV